MVMKFINNTDKIKGLYISSKKQSRIKIGNHQKRILEKTFEKTNYLDLETKLVLERETLIPSKNISIWFQNKRRNQRNKY